MENSRKLTPQAQSHCCALSDVLGFKQKKTFITFAHFVDTTSLVFELPLEIICFILSFLKPVVSKDRAYQFNSKWGNVNCQMFAFPRGLCVNDKNKQTYVSDTKERIQIFDKNHTLISSFSGKGFILPTGLDVNERTGKIYVCDSYNHRIQSFDFDGNHISVFGKHGTSEGMFDSPFYISSVGDDGLVFIADYGNKRVQVMNEEGKFLYSFGDRSSNFSSYPTGIAASRFSDKVFVGEEETGKIHVFSQKGDFLFSFGRNEKIQDALIGRMG
eukprot:TRINITY_DN4376_c0_g1_i3.p1 TRINITY_DN4376_c0_g1~~TRINITY_DN4376_c0_g1_i3.p1  ORF type:complete len:272 (+),score=32.15 TRINITY_DN4376_c0_g1_i3:75-890(+)